MEKWNAVMVFFKHGISLKNNFQNAIKLCDVGELSHFVSLIVLYIQWIKSLCRAWREIQ